MALSVVSKVTKIHPRISRKYLFSSRVGGNLISVTSCEEAARMLHVRVVTAVLHCVIDNRQPPAWLLEVLQRVTPMSKALFDTEPRPPARETRKGNFMRDKKIREAIHGIYGIDTDCGNADARTLSPECETLYGSQDTIPRRATEEPDSEF